MTTPGLLSVWNDIAAEDDAEFNAWYGDEHLPERLGVDGILTARRYRDLDAPLSYAAIYDTRTLEALRSPVYLEMLANPSPRTRSIMPRFRNMVRGASNVLTDIGASDPAGERLAVLELGNLKLDTALLDRLLRKSAAIFNQGAVRRVRLALPDAAATGVPNPESRLRPTPDRSPTPFLLIEGDDENAVRAAADELNTLLDARGTPRAYALIDSRSDPD